MGAEKRGWWYTYWFKQAHPDIDGVYVATVKQTWSCGPIKDLTDLTDGLEVVSDYLDKTQYVREFDRYQGKISQIKSGVNAVKDNLSNLDEVCNTINSVLKIDEGVSALIRIGDIRNDPEGAAVAFGKTLSGIGEIAKFLPYPVSAYVGILSGAEDFFVNMRHSMNPRVHMREPGIKEVIDNL